MTLVQFFDRLIEKLSKMNYECGRAEDPMIALRELRSCAVHVEEDNGSLALYNVVDDWRWVRWNLEQTDVFEEFRGDQELRSRLEKFLERGRKKHHRRYVSPAAIPR
jgi:hypothetical protein